MTDVGASDKLKLFISYSPRDLAFADWLVAALKARGFEVRIDRQDLPKLEDWERELLDFIRQADTVVFVASQHSLASKIVEWEIEQVRLHGKRLAPVVIGDITGIGLPQEIAKITYVTFDNLTVFEQRADELARALKTNVAWLKEHTRLGELATRWLERGKPEDVLLRGQDLTDAEKWASQWPRNAPIVTEAQWAYLKASRSAQKSQALRRRYFRFALGLSAACGFAYLAWSTTILGSTAYAVDG